MDYIFFRGLALFFTCLILTGAALVPTFLVTSKVLALKELFFANPETALIKIAKLQKFNELPEKDLDMLESKSLWSASK